MTSMIASTTQTPTACPPTTRRSKALTLADPVSLRLSGWPKTISWHDPSSAHLFPMLSGRANCWTAGTKVQVEVMPPKVMSWLRRYRPDGFHDTSRWALEDWEDWEDWAEEAELLLSSIDWRRSPAGLGSSTIFSVSVVVESSPFR